MVRRLTARGLKLSETTSLRGCLRNAVGQCHCLLFMALITALLHRVEAHEKDALLAERLTRNQDARTTLHRTGDAPAIVQIFINRPCQLSIHCPFIVQTGKTPAERAVTRRFETLIHRLCAKTKVY